ncbi:hypothetical protein ACN42_g5362 [Penicillium freii]|uniref:Uncharacterized protein n=1 Tax=Penicillium freii TaxID=48697 RepID=A0A101MJJ6_PENFR|nr:hypothetical protein ACN42_g5362 [Penicillium freii]
MKLDQPVSLWNFRAQREERNESEGSSSIGEEEEKGGRKKIPSSLIIIEAGNGGSAQAPSDRSETSMLFWVILSHNRGGTDYLPLMGVKGVLYVINVVLNGIEWY